MNLQGMLDSGVETATAEAAQNYAVVNDIAGETVAESTLPNAPGSEPVLDSANIERAAFVAVEKPVEAGVQAPQETVAEQVEKQAGEENYGRGANKRIRDLVAERNETRDMLAKQQAEFQRQMQQMQMQIASQQAAYQKHQMELEERRMKALESDRIAREEAGLSEVEKARRNFLRDAQKEALQGIAPEIDALKKQLEGERQWREQLTAKAEQKARFAKIDAMGREVLEKELLAGYTPEEAAQLKEPMEEMLHAFAGAYKQYPQQVAPRFQQFLQKWYAAESRKLSRSAGAKIAQSQAVSAPLPAAKTTAGASQTNWPSLVDLKKSGHENHLAWIRAGSPGLKK